MSTGQFIKTESKSLSGILVGDDRYSIPRFQRDYSWSKSEWEALRSDIDEMMKSSESHFFGHVVQCPSENEDNVFQIIDGQQRLTTVLIITLAAAITFKSAGDSKGNSDVVDKGLVYCNSLLCATDITSDTPPLRIELNHRNKGYFKSMVLEHEAPKPVEFTNTNNKLRAALNFFKNWFKEMELKNVAKTLQKLHKNFYMSVVTVNSMGSAFSVFESLNHKGSRLQVADLIKNMLMEKIAKDDMAGSRSDEMLAAIDAQWDSVVKKVGEKEISNYLRSFAMLDSGGKIVNMKKLYIHVNGRVKGKEAASEHLKLLDSYASSYRSIRGMTPSHWKHGGKDLSVVLPALRVLRLFDIRMPISLLMAAADLYDVEDYLELVKAIIIVSVRFSVVGNNPSRDLEKQYALLVNEVKNQGCKTPEVVKKLCDNKFYPDDETFFIDFKGLRIKSSHSGRATYFLASIENNKIDLDFSSYGVIKIANKDDDGNWVSALGTETLQDIENGLANYCLKDGTGGNEKVNSFSSFKAMSGNDDFYTSRLVFEAEQWNNDAYEQRRSWLADQALTVWKLNGYS